jgi:exopolysaccharide biosynthesis polyprenyl glycosylphosphotransferase
MSKTHADLPDVQRGLTGSVTDRVPFSMSPLALAAPREVVVDPRTARSSEPLWLRHGVGPYLLVGDLAAFGVATLVTRPQSWVHILVLVLYVVIFLIAGLYRSRLTLAVLDDFPYILAAVGVAVAVKIAILGLIPLPIDPVRQLMHATVLLAMIMLIRILAYAVVRQARRVGVASHRAVIVGAGEVGVRLAASMLEHREYGLEPVGFVELEAKADMSPLPLPNLGSYDELPAVIQRNNIRNVIVAFGGVREADLVDILSTTNQFDVEVFWVPRLFELHNAKRDTDHLWGIPLVRARQAAFRSPLWPVKRIMDLLVAGLALLVLSPVLAICAIAVRREGGPGIIFRQERVGLDGRSFEVLKFRSLKPVDDSESQTNWNIKHDDRLGPVGKFIRSTSIDELPQLWNIVRGEMSLVGPRPERPHFVNQFSTHIPRYTARHRVPVGLTGWAQAHGLRGDTSIEDRARFDNYYIENWSPWLDTKIVIKTVSQVLRRQGG